MSANKANKSFLLSIIEFHHQPILIAGNIKNNPIVSNHTCISPLEFYSLRA